MVGPAKSGKSALMAALAGHLQVPARVYGEVLVNGRPLPSATLQPTYFSAWDEPMTNLPIEQVLMFTGVRGLLLLPLLFLAWAVGEVHVGGM